MDNKTISDYLKNWKVFLISLGAMFVITSLIQLGVKMPKAFSQTVTPEVKKIDILNENKYKLETDFNFEVKKPLNVIPEVSANADYEEAAAYGVIDMESGEVLASKNLSEQLPIASITKVMTAVVALDLATPADMITVSRSASEMVPSKIMLKPGEKLSLEELLNSLLLASANDSAEAIKDGVDNLYGEKVFIRAMNLKARELGLENSSFSNPQGFDSESNFSSVEDLMVLSKYALENYPLITEIVRKENEDFSDGVDPRFYLNNWNGLLGVYPGIFGIKIGNTGRAGKTTLVGAERDGKKLLSVILGAPGVLERDMWASQILDLGFEKSVGAEPINITEEQLKDKYAAWKY